MGRPDSASSGRRPYTRRGSKKPYRWKWNRAIATAETSEGTTHASIAARDGRALSANRMRMTVRTA